MATHIRTIELRYGVHSFILPADCTSALALVTLDGSPLGDIRMDAEPGALVTADQLIDLIAGKFRGKLLQAWLAHSMGVSGANATGSRPLSVNVVVPTCNRSDDLERCLRSLRAAANERTTITVVDNGSEGLRTREIAERHGARYIREHKRGLDFARNAGIVSSEADIVAFADDDVVVDRQWVASIARTFEEDESIACVTGLTMSMEIRTEAHYLFEQYCNGAMRRGYDRQVFHRMNLRPIAAGKVGVGANMAFRRRVFDTVGRFDEALDCGTPAHAAGETDMFYRLLKEGFKIVYEPSVLSWHSNRSEMHELRKQLHGYSVAVYAFLTKCILEYRDFSAFACGYQWFRHHHLRNLVLGVRKKTAMPFGMTLAEIKGVFQGPGAYLRSKLYVSGIRMAEGTERRLPVSAETGIYNRNGHSKRASMNRAVLSRLRTPWRCLR